MEGKNISTYRDIQSKAAFDFFQCHQKSIILKKATDLVLNPFTSWSVQIKHKIGKSIDSVQEQCEHNHPKVLIESFHLSGHTFRFHWTFQDLELV